MPDRLFDILAAFVLRRPRTILLVAGALAVALGWWGAATIRLNANLDDLIARDRPYTARYREFLREFGDLEHIYVVVDSKGDAPAARAAVQEIVDRFRAIPGLSGVYGWISPEEQLRVASRAMSDFQLRDLVRASGGALETLRAPSALTLAKAADRELESLVSRISTLAPERREQVAAGALFMAAALGSGSDGPLGALASHGLDREHLASDTGRLYFVQVRAQKDFGSLDVIAAPLRAMRSTLAEIGPRHPRVEIGLTGRPILQADELSTSNHDMTRASIIALVLCSILFIWMTRSLLRPVLAIAVFLMACGWTYGAAAIMVGQLNLLSIVFMLVLVGVGLDYGVHVIARHRELRRDHTVADTVRTVLRTAGRSNVTGATTSAAVFFMAWFTHFQGLRELGLIAGVGILLCLVAMITVLPAALVLTDARLIRRDKQQPIDKPGRVFRVVNHFVTHRPGLTLTLAAVSLVALFAAPGRPRFEKNLLKLQAQGLESVEWEHRIREDSSAATWFGASIAGSLDEAARIEDAARNTPTIGQVRSVLDVIRPDTPERAVWRERLRTELVPAMRSGVLAPSDPIELGDALAALVARLDALATAAAAVGRAEAATLRAIADSLRPLPDELRSPAGPQAAVRVDGSLSHVRASLRTLIEGDALPLRDALPDAVRDEMISPSGKLLVMLHPKEDVWDYDAMKVFIDDMRRIDPQVTGAPISHFESLGEMQQAFVRMSILAVIAITALLWLDFRRATDVLLCFLPLAVGMGWSLEAMGAMNVSFNLANFFAVPIMIGLGVDSAVHVLHRYKEGGPERFTLGATRRAVLLTALTTIIGFGALVIARHRGLYSLGVAMALGATGCMLSSLIVLPAALALLEKVRPSHRSPQAPS